MDTEPLLSICIPTYNRANWLAASLQSLIPQVVACDGDVELVVSDNCSTDSTQSILEEYSTCQFFRGHRNSVNVGGTPNMHILASSLAQGKYFWVFGDDDTVLEGSVEHIVDLLRKFPDTDLAYVNYSNWIPQPGETAPSIELIQSTEVCGSARLDDFPLKTVAELVGMDNNCFAPTCSIVVRRSVGSELFADSAVLGISGAASILPHVVFIANNMLKRPALHIGRRCVFGANSISWDELLPIYAVKYMPDLFDLFEHNGCAREAIDPLRDHLLNNSTRRMIRMLRGVNVENRSEFSIWYFVWRFRSHKTMWKMLPKVIILWAISFSPAGLQKIIERSLSARSNKFRRRRRTA